MLTAEGRKLPPSDSLLTAAEGRKLLSPDSVLTAAEGRKLLSPASVLTAAEGRKLLSPESVTTAAEGRKLLSPDSVLNRFKQLHERVNSMDRHVLAALVEEVQYCRRKHLSSRLGLLIMYLVSKSVCITIHFELFR
jgi:hypothetical protein